MTPEKEIEIMKWLVDNYPNHETNCVEIWELIKIVNHYHESKVKKLNIPDVMARTSDANNASMATRIGELNSLHVAAYMDIEKTTQSLNNILAYKKELALTMLQCSDEEQMKILAEAIKYSDDMIRKVLGMYVP